MANLPATIGRYRITGELGRGGMGVVYRAVDPQLDRQVAVKRISLEGAELSATELENRFLREARLAARLHHSSVATVFDAGRDGDALFLVMELVEGESLQRRLARGLFPSAQESLELAAQVADALAVAHHSGIIHRDIKPANILLNRQGAVKVSDFGVAKAVGEGTELTRSGTVIGSPAYMAPEQIQGQGVDARADIFSLGVVLYELLLHRRPFPADTVTTLIYQILHQDPLDDPLAMRALGPDLAALLRQALAKNPAERVQDAQSFARRARELKAQMSTGEQVATGATVKQAGRQEPPPPPAAAQPPGPSRAPLWVGLGVGLVGALLLVGAYSLLRQPPPPEIGVAQEPARQAPAPAPAPVRIESRPVPTQPAAPAAEPPMREETVIVSPPPVGEVRPNPARPAVPRPEPVPATPAPAAAAPPSPGPDAVQPEVVAAPAPAPPTPVPAAPALAVAQVFHCSKGAEFHVSPEETLVTLDGRRLGPADDWDGSGGGQTFMFTGPGTHDVLLSLEGYETVRVQIVVSPNAEEEIAEVDTELEKRKKR